MWYQPLRTIHKIYDRMVMNRGIFTYVGIITDGDIYSVVACKGLSFVCFMVAIVWRILMFKRK